MEVVKMVAQEQEIFGESGESHDGCVALLVVPSEPERIYIALVMVDQEDKGVSSYTPLGRGPKAGVELALGNEHSIRVELYADRDAGGWVTGIVDVVENKDGQEVWRDTTERVMGERGLLMVGDTSLYRGVVNDLLRDAGYLSDRLDDDTKTLNLHDTQRLYWGLERQLDTIF